MNKKEKFIEMVEYLISITPSSEADFIEADWSEGMSYFDAFKTSVDKKEKAQFTDNGKLVLKTMLENQEEKQNMFKAKDIAEIAFVSARTVSGSIRKLVTDGYVEKMGQDPIIYSLTEVGKEVQFED